MSENVTNEQDNNLLYELLSNHVGHDISIVNYGHGINMSLECNDCGCVIFDSDVYDLCSIDEWNY